MSKTSVAIRVLLLIAFCSGMIALAMSADDEHPRDKMKRLETKEKLMQEYIDNHCPGHYKPWEVLEEKK